jgi:hypothetical protein
LAGCGSGFRLKQANEYRLDREGDKGAAFSFLPGAAVCALPPPAAQGGIFGSQSLVCAGAGEQNTRKVFIDAANGVC